MNKILLHYLSERPALYAPSTSKFWDDEHISKGMLEAHLDPDWEAATRKLDFVQRSVNWIANVSNPLKRTQLLDLGCGPGIYAELFAEAGFRVTGIDLSPRSINYARESAVQKNTNIFYQCQNYLTLNYCEEFDVITLIYCDFGVLSKEERKILLSKIYRALKPNGLLLLDAFTAKEYEKKAETKSWSYDSSGYWSENPYACLYSFYRYDDYSTFVDQYIIVEKDTVNRYIIWNHAFSIAEMQTDLNDTGFQRTAFYENVAGDDYTDSSTTLCASAHKIHLS